jgi:hypothetical protein
MLSSCLVLTVWLSEFMIKRYLLLTAKSISERKYCDVRGKLSNVINSLLHQTLLLVAYHDSDYSLLHVKYFCAMGWITAKRQSALHGEDGGNEQTVAVKRSIKTSPSTTVQILYVCQWSLFWIKKNSCVFLVCLILKQNSYVQILDRPVHWMGTTVTKKELSK